MADLQISALPPLTGALLQGGDPFAVADLSASETKKISASELAAGLAGLFPAGSIPSGSVNLTSAPGSITSLELAAKAVTAAKLDDNSSAAVGAALPAAGAFVGQLAYTSTDDALRIWDGSSWQALKAAGSVNSFVDDTSGTVRFTSSVAAGVATLSVELAATTAARQFFAGPTTAGGPAVARQIVPADLPSATATEQGVVQIGGGLAVTGGVVSVDNVVVPSAAATYGVVEYNAFGLVTSGRAITSADLPRSLLGQPGAISPGAEFTVDGAGDLHHANSVPSGTATKVTYDAQGHITGGTTLVPADIPNLDASKITTGALPTDRLADHSVTSIKLADYATAYIQDVQPANAGNTIGQLWLNPLAQQIRMWDGNVWVPIGVGALSEQNLRFCGLFTAVDGKITILTQFGRDAGYKVGDVLPVATDQLTGSYFVCDTAGNGVAVTPGVTYDPGDWCVCLGVAQGWERVDTLSGGGGGGTTTLDGLIDVDVPSPGAGQVLTYDGAVWKAGAIGNASIAGRGLIELATQAEVDAGIDAERAVTPATLKTYVASAAPTVPDATEAVKGIAQLADAGAVTAGLANRVVQASQLKTTNDTLATAVTNITNLQTSVTTLQGQTVDATTTVKGIVQLADAAAITAGTAGRVVTADQLKTTNDALATAVGGGVTTINGTAPITVTGTGNTRTVAVADATTAAKGVVQLADAVAITAGTAGRVVDAAQLKAFTPADASETVKGVIELATTAEVLTGTDTVRAVTPKGLKDNYLAKDISKLPALP